MKVPKRKLRAPNTSDLPEFDTAFVRMENVSNVKRLVRTRSKSSIIIGVSNGANLGKSCNVLFWSGYTLNKVVPVIDTDLTFSGDHYMFFSNSIGLLPDKLSNMVYRGTNFLHELNVCAYEGKVINLDALHPSFENVRSRSQKGETLTVIKETLE